MNRSPLVLAAALLSGIIFGVGLAVARMTDPAKIKDFLDIAAIPTGGWDPSLAFVMGGGLLIAIFGLRLDRVLRRPVAAPAFIKTHRVRIDPPLVIGAALFGVGWGLSGFCPGPAIANLGLVPGDVVIFVAAMLAGGWIAGLFMDWAPAKPVAPAAAPAE
jgi:uncharacterized membrane protein YedE/YeeE